MRKYEEGSKDNEKGNNQKKKKKKKNANGNSTKTKMDIPGVRISC